MYKMLSTAIIKSPLSQQLILRAHPAFVLTSKWELLSKRNYAKPAITGIAGLGKKKLGKAGPVVEKKVLPVETDTVKLVTHCCGLNYKIDGEHPKLKDDSEYPDWLWTLDTSGKVYLDQLDPDTEEYWNEATKRHKKRLTSLLRLKKF